MTRRRVKPGGLTTTLAVEYARTGVTFTCPFATRTAFLDGPTIAPIVGTMPKFMVQSPRRVAQIGVAAVRHVHVPGT